MQRTRTIILLSVILGIFASQSGTISSSASAAPTEAVTIHGADAQTAELIERSVARFAEAGLELPNIEFFVHDDTDQSDCNGHEGFWRPGSGADRIDICVAGEFLILHELGHAFEHHSVDDTTRLAFMALYPGSEWQDDGASHDSQGKERFATVVGWGLQFDPIPEDVDAFRMNALQKKGETFELITGVASPRLSTATA